MKTLVSVLIAGGLSSTGAFAGAAERSPRPYDAERNVIVRHGKVTEITLRVAPGAVEKPKK